MSNLVSVFLIVTNFPKYGNKDFVFVLPALQEVPLIKSAILNVDLSKNESRTNASALKATTKEFTHLASLYHALLDINGIQKEGNASQHVLQTQ